MNEKMTEAESLAMLKAVAKEMIGEDKWTGLEKVRVVQIEQMAKGQWEAERERVKSNLRNQIDALNKLIVAKAPAEEINQAQLDLAMWKGVEKGVTRAYAVLGVLIKSGTLQKAEAHMEATIPAKMLANMTPDFEEAEQLMEAEIAKQKAEYNAK